MVYCTECGAELQAEAKYCAHCGEAVDVDARVPETDVEGDLPFSEGLLSLSLGYSFRNDKRPLLIGGLINLVGFIVPFIGLISVGYGFRLCRAVARGQTERPAFEEYGELFVDGLRLSVLVFAYGFLFLALAFAVGVGLGQGNEGVAAAGGFSLVVVLFYLMPGALTVYAATESFDAAFSTTYLVPFVLSGTYLKAMVLWTALSLLLGVVFVLSIFTIVGFFFVSALFNYVAGAFWGYVYREAVERGEVPSPPARPV